MTFLASPWQLAGPSFNLPPPARGTHQRVFRPEHADSGIVVTLWRPTEAGKPKWCNGIKFWMGGIGAVWDAGEALWVVDAYVLNGFLIFSFLLATAVLIFSYQAL